MSNPSGDMWSVLIPAGLLFASVLLFPRAKSVRALLLCLIFLLLSEVIGSTAALMDLPNGRGSVLRLLRHALLVGAAGGLAWHWFQTTRRRATGRQ